MDMILEYIKSTYAPVSVILYGSYADKTNNLNSDFDALVISASHPQHHDTSLVGGILLDVFVYPAEYFDGAFDCADFVQICDGKVVMDTENRGADLQAKVRTYLQSRPPKTVDEVRASVDWCLKMCDRAKRGDAEGMYRWHWLLTDSLEIFCDVVGKPYFGPKKTLIWMRKTYPEAFACCEKALKSFDMESLEGWVHCIRQHL